MDTERCVLVCITSVCSKGPWQVCVAERSLLTSRQVGFGFFLARQKHRCQFFLKDTPCLVLDVSMAQSLTYLTKMECTMWFTSKVNRIHAPTAPQDTQSDEGAAEKGGWMLLV